MVRYSADGQNMRAGLAMIFKLHFSGSTAIPETRSIAGVAVASAETGC